MKDERKVERKTNNDSQEAGKIMDAFRHLLRHSFGEDVYFVYRISLNRSKMNEILVIVMIGGRWACHPSVNTNFSMNEKRGNIFESKSWRKMTKQFSLMKVLSLRPVWIHSNSINRTFSQWNVKTNRETIDENTFRNTSENIFIGFLLFGSIVGDELDNSPLGDVSQSGKEKETWEDALQNGCWMSQLIDV